jgi:hypothetical protein
LVAGCARGRPVAGRASPVASTPVPAHSRARLGWLPRSGPGGSPGLARRSTITALGAGGRVALPVVALLPTGPTPLVRRRLRRSPALVPKTLGR